MKNKHFFHISTIVVEEEEQAVAVIILTQKLPVNIHNIICIIAH
jgi:hypothetical protein